MRLCDVEKHTDKRYHSPQEPLYIVGLDWQLQWYPSEVEQVKQAWQEGKGLVAIAREVKSTPQAVFLLLLDLAEQGKISKRINYIWGCE